MITQKAASSVAKQGFINCIRNIFFLNLAMALFFGCASTYAGETSNTLTDANIAAIVVGANKIDISAGHIAMRRSKTPEVRKFAQRMIEDHTDVLNSAIKLVAKLRVTPVDNELVAALSEQSQKHEAKLKTLSGKAFDKSYIDHEVTYHKAVIGVIEDQLIPGVTNQELKDVLVSVVPAFKTHLKHCQMIQEKIS